jgi:hypothetical protein
MTDDELNQWAAEFMGFGIYATYHRDWYVNGIRYVCPVSEWNPCQDHHQAQMVVNKLLERFKNE